MDNQSGEEIEVRDFSYNSDVRPISDPNIFSETQRLAQNQALLQMATSAPPGMFDIRAVYKRILGQLKIPAIEEVLPNPQGAKESNPALENVAMTMGRMAAAYPDQDHLAHIEIHLEYAKNPNYGGNPVIGPMFAPKVIEHIKQHLMLHYLQSMRSVVAQASEGKDVLDLHQEKTIDGDSQRALAIASKIVDEDSQEQLQPYMQDINALVQKVQQMHLAQQQQAMGADPTAQVLLKTQMAETERKTQEFQAKMQADVQKATQDYQLKVAELQQKVTELQAKYQTQTDIDSQRNATDIAMANINNAARERIAMINAGAQMDQQQMQLEHEQDLSAMEAIHAASEDIRQHGLAIEQQNFQQQAQMVQQQAQQDAQYQAQAGLANQQHQQALQQNDQAHTQQMQQALPKQQQALPEQQQLQPQPPTQEQQ
jgi:hypothetical protein